jgi:predicted outer membrane repeat protein
MASPEKFQRFVSADKGEDTPTGGRAAGDKPLKTIGAALAQLVAARAGGTQRLSIKIAPGTYKEHLNLVSNLSIVGDDRRAIKRGEFPSVRILRDAGASVQGTTDASPPTGENVITIRGTDIEVVGLFIDGDGRPQRGVSIVKCTNVTLAGCRIASCHADVYHPKFRGTQDDPLREPPIRQGKGSGLIINNSTKITITGCVFDNNGNKLTFRRRIYDSVVARIIASLGPIDALGARVLLASESKKTEPIRDSSGGHVEMEQTDQIRFVDSFFDNGTCTGRGGAIHAFKDAFFDVDRCQFQNNRAETDGGAIAINNEAFINPKRKLITISSCVVDRNFAGDDGGGIYATSKTLLRVVGSTISNNQANTNGGGLRITFGCEVTIEGCLINFNQNNVDFATKNTENKDGGGGIGVNNSSLILDNTTLDNNVTHGFAGGGLYFITAGYNAQAERGAKLSHGETFDDILKNRNKFNVSSFQLVIRNGTRITNNRTPDETFYEDQGKLVKGGAGCGIYVLLSSATKDSPALGLPISVVLDGSFVLNNQSEHRDDEQKAEIVIRGATSVSFSGETIVKHPANKFLYSFFKVKSKDMSKSTTFAAGLATGVVLDK